ncbi:hypothetical protein CDL15_Pgr019297 [Punica granatum]|uniref:Uncharacterized protein n=1 Tax=Punica granatum TaxID=22663 RepID=A0A218XQY8_PUNGR|nr:hypothetical protein CDL15_Pgr019297 [Punica granatum]
MRVRASGRYHGSIRCNQDGVIVKFGSPLGFRLEAELLLTMHCLCKGSHKAFAGVQRVQRRIIHFPCTYCKEDRVVFEQEEELDLVIELSKKLNISDTVEDVANRYLEKNKF